MISRTLGNELGGAIGVLLFLAFGIHAAFLMVGLSDVSFASFGFLSDADTRMGHVAVGSVVLMLIFILCFAGARTLLAFAWMLMMDG